MAGSKIDERWDASKQTLVDAAKRAGVDPEIMVKIAGFESKYNSHAQPIAVTKPENNKVRQWDGTMAISSAYGYGQFLDDTWNKMIHKYGEKYGIPDADKLSMAQTNAPAIRDNPQLQAAMLAEFTRENVEKGARLGGRDPDANVYALHNLGDKDGTAFLTALKNNPNQRVDSILSAKVIHGNASLYGNGSVTLAEAYARMGNFMDDYQKYATEARGMTGQVQTPNPAPQTPGGQTPRPGAGNASSTADTPEPARNGVNWPAPGNHTLNKADKPGEGRGEFGTPRGDHRHGGVDIQGKVGDPIESFMPGRVIAVKPNNGDAGNMIVIDHGNGLTSTYMHLDKMYAKVGQKVPEDVEVIGTMGRSGNTPKHGDTHLHFEIHDAKAVTAQNPKGRVDPLPILNGAQQLDGPGAKAEARSELKLHDKGADVEHLQKRLNDLGYTDAAGKKLATDRDFGNHTREAVEQFQRENGLKATGVADKETLRLVEKGMTRHAAADGQLQPGEKGPDVRGLQENLNQLGLTGTNGKPLKVDGDYGDSTREAVRKFQEAHGLPQSGTADRATLEKLGEQVKFEPKITADGRVTGPITEGGSRTSPADTPQAPPTDRTPPQPPTQADKPSMADPKHPDNAMYKQALTNLEQLGPNAFKSREELERAAAAVTSDARASGLTSIDHIAKTNAASGNQTLLVAVQGDPTSPASKNSYIDYSQAVTQTVDQSSRMAEAAGARQAQQADAPQPENRVAVGAR